MDNFVLSLLYKPICTLHEPSDTLHEATCTLYEPSDTLHKASEH